MNTTTSPAETASFVSNHADLEGGTWDTTGWTTYLHADLAENINEIFEIAFAAALDTDDDVIGYRLGVATVEVTVTGDDYDAEDAYQRALEAASEATQRRFDELDAAGGRINA